MTLQLCRAYEHQCSSSVIQSLYGWLAVSKCNVMQVDFAAKQLHYLDAPSFGLHWKHVISKNFCMRAVMSIQLAIPIPNNARVHRCAVCRSFRRQQQQNLYSKVVARASRKLMEREKERRWIQIYMHKYIA